MSVVVPVRCPARRFALGWRRCPRGTTGFGWRRRYGRARVLSTRRRQLRDGAVPSLLVVGTVDLVFAVTLFADSDRRLQARIRAHWGDSGQQEVWTVAGAAEFQRVVADLVSDYQHRTGAA